MATPPLRQGFVDARPGGPNTLPAAEYNLNAQRTDAAYDAANAIYSVDALGADPTGATPSDTAFAAAITAMGANPGVLRLGRGTYHLTSTKTLGHPGQGIVGQGSAVSFLDYTGTGDCLRVYDSTVALGNLAGAAGPLYGFHIMGWSDSNANISGLHIGDLLAIDIRDVQIRGFQTSGAKGFWGHNINSWSERAHIQVMTGLCTDAFIFDHESWAYGDFMLDFLANANQNAVTLKNTAGMNGTRIFITGNCNTGGGGNTGTVFTVGSSGTDNCRVRGQLYIACESNGGSVAHTDFNVSSPSGVDCMGALDFDEFTSPFQAGTANPGTVRFAGRKNCRALGRMSADQSFALTDYAPLKAALTPTDVPVAPALFDSFTGTDGASLSGNWAVTTGGAAAAAAVINANRGRMTTGATGGYSGADKVFVVSTLPSTLADVEILLRHTFGAVAVESYQRYAVRATNTDPQFGSNYLLMVTSSVVELQKHVSDAETVLFNSAFTGLGLAAPSNGARKWIRLRAKGTTISCKVWDDGVAEPVAWTYSTTDSSVAAGGATLATISGGGAAASGINYIDQFHIYAL